MPETIACADCGLPYGEPGWCDCYIPNDVWAAISPSGDEGGILCITCIARRLVVRRIDHVPLLVTSGPFAHEPNEAFQRGFSQALLMSTPEFEEARYRAELRAEGFDVAELRR